MEDASLDSSEAALYYQLEQARPRRLLLLAPTLPGTLRAWCENHDCAITLLRNATEFNTLTSRFDFAIVQNYLETISKAEGLAQLGQLRNVYSAKIWVEVESAQAWAMNDFLGLGFKRLAHADQVSRPTQTSQPNERNVDCYGYDLTSYNHVRSWNNPKHWANPENFGKFRW